MSLLDFREFLESADLYAGQAHEEDDIRLRTPLIVIATILAWCAIEEFVNSMLEDFSEISHLFDLHEQALLTEQRLTLVDAGIEAGTFVLRGTEYRSIEQKILFLLAKFGRGHTATQLAKSTQLWNDFQEFKKVRDAFVHPRTARSSVNVNDAVLHVECAKDVIRVLGHEVWGKEIQF